MIPLTLKMLPEGFSDKPPRSPWGINFGGGVDSTAVILHCMERFLQPDWILFADTGSEKPETLEHVYAMKSYLKVMRPKWPEITIVRWIRKDGTFEALHDNCIRTNYLPSKAYGYAGCTSKWKIYPMDR